MPFYDYRYLDCHETFDKLVKTRPGPSVLECPKCGTLTATRQLSAFATPGQNNQSSCLPAGGG